MLATIEISSIIISFNSDSNNLICVLFWSDIPGSSFSFVYLGIANAVFMLLAPSMLIAATPVGAASTSRTIVYSGLTEGYLKCFHFSMIDCSNQMAFSGTCTSSYKQINWLNIFWL